MEAASQKKAPVLHVASQRAILDADIAADDSICYLSSEPGYKSVLYVYNSQQSLIYRWLSADVLSTNPIWLCFATWCWSCRLPSARLRWDSIPST